MQEKIGEYLEKVTKTKQVFYYYNKNEKRMSKEVFLNLDKVVHYPRYYKYDFREKYKNIEKICFIGFNNKLPIGINKSANKGYGFTRITSPLGEYLDTILKIKEVIVEKKGEQNFDKKTKTIVLNENILTKLTRTLTLINEKQKEEKKIAFLEVLAPYFPKEIKVIKRRYKPNDLSIAINNWDNSFDGLSQDDRIALKNLFQMLSFKKDFLDFTSVAETKLAIDSQYLEVCLHEYSQLLKQSRDTPALERKWHNFLKEKSWIFSYIFSQPVILYKNEAFIGGKNIENKGGRFSDFLIQNKLSNNISFLEIKTHKSKLLKDKPYRGDDVFAVSDDLSGSINQVLDQRDIFQKDYYNLIGKSKDTKREITKLFNPRCIVLIGCLSDLSDNQKKCFEIFRNNSKDVEIITFDELGQRIASFQTILHQKG